MPIEYNPAARVLQDQHDTRRMADRLAEISPPMITAEMREMIESLDMFFLATCDDKGQPQVSYKGGAPGFVTVLDDRSLAFPIYNGNGMFLSVGNIMTNRNVGLLFIDFARPYRCRVNGTASVDAQDPLMANYPEAQMIVRVQVREVFGNCPRYIHKMQLVQHSEYVPQANRETPIARWKYLNVIQDALPAQDQQAIGERLSQGEKIVDLDMTKPLRDQL